MDSYAFKPHCSIVLAPWEIEAIARLPEGVHEAVAGHGAYKVEVHVWEDNITLRLDHGPCTLEVATSGETLLSLAGERRLIVVEGKGVGVAEVRGRHYYKLVPTVPGSYPTLEINGIHMHRVSGSDPRRDTEAKIRAARVRRGHRVLDTCMGLGYTAVHSALRGAEVITVEIDPNVIELARLNPWSWGLADSAITTVRGDATLIVRELPSGWFDRIIHDPPRITGSTGELYSTSFYRELFRVLRRGGILYHYTGEPGRKHGSNFPGRVAGRLRSVGFDIIRYDRVALGVVARKP